jgi:hypothetical protein
MSKLKKGISVFSIIILLTIITIFNFSNNNMVHASEGPCCNYALGTCLRPDHPPARDCMTLYFSGSQCCCLQWDCGTML